MKYGRLGYTSGQKIVNFMVRRQLKFLKQLVMLECVSAFENLCMCALGFLFLFLYIFLVQQTFVLFLVDSCWAPSSDGCHVYFPSACMTALPIFVSYIVRKICELSSYLGKRVFPPSALGDVVARLVLANTTLSVAYIPHPGNAGTGNFKYITLRRKGLYRRGRMA